jgi:hypothetical protein
MNPEKDLRKLVRYILNHQPQNAQYVGEQVAMLPTLRRHREVEIWNVLANLRRILILTKWPREAP